MRCMGMATIRSTDIVAGVEAGAEAKSVGGEGREIRGRLGGVTGRLIGRGRDAVSDIMRILARAVMAGGSACVSLR